MNRRKSRIISSALVFTLLLLDALSIYALENIDSSILEFTSSLWTDSTNLIITQITDLSGETAVVTFSVSIVIILAILKKWDSLYFTLMSLIGCIVLFSIFKSLVGRVRPVTKMFDPGEFAFPSGHAAMSMCMCLILYLLIRPLLSSLMQRWLLPVFLLFPLMISFTRVYLHVHYPSDVFGGMALSISWVLLMSYIYLPNEISKTKQV